MSVFARTYLLRVKCTYLCTRADLMSRSCLVLRDNSSWYRRVHWALHNQGLMFTLMAPNNLIMLLRTPSRGSECIITIHSLPMSSHCHVQTITPPMARRHCQESIVDMRLLHTITLKLPQEAWTLTVGCICTVTIRHRILYFREPK